MEKCGDIWNANAISDTDRAALEGGQLLLGNTKESFGINGFYGGMSTTSMLAMPESPLIGGFGKESQSFQGIIDDKYLKKCPANLSGSMDDSGQKNYLYNANALLPWTPSSDVGPWNQEIPLLENHLTFPVGGSQQLEFSTHPMQAFLGQKQRHDLFEGIGDSLYQHERPDTNFSDLVTPAIPNYHHQKSMFLDSPYMSGLSKEISDKDLKPEMRAESSDCSDPMEDDEDKGDARSGRRHLSKNLVAERKRRKKLNERLYSLRALVPKITKMDRASILGDAIEYVKELQQQVKDLQEELLETKDDELNGNTLYEDAGLQADENGNLIKADQVDCSLKAGPLDPNNDQRIEGLSQPMQVEVSKLDGQVFSLRIFCEKRPGVFVKLMQALDVLGLEVLHANITTFRGLVLNVFNAEVRDKELIQAEQVKESLLEITSLCESRNTCILNDLPLEKELVAPIAL